MGDKEFHSEFLVKSSPELYKKLDIKLEYYLTQGIIKDDDVTGKELKTFGIEVVKKEYLQEIIVNTEKESINNLFLDKSRTIELLTKLSENLVTPIGLFEVLDNLIGVVY